MTKLTKQPALIDKAFTKLLSTTDKINPALTALLHKRYAADREAFIQAAEIATPSQDPAYWAKRSCSKCYGRGTLGVRHTFTLGQPATVQRVFGKKVFTNSVAQTHIQCSCTIKGYQVWLVEFRKSFNSEQARIGECDNDQTG